MKFAVSLIYLLMQYAASTVSNKYYTKIDTPSFAEPNYQCILDAKDLPPKLNLKVTCGALCNAKHGCRMFCLKGTQCSLHRAVVAPRWKLPSVTGLGTTASYDSCYTSWWDERDVTDKITEYKTELRMTEHGYSHIGIESYNHYAKLATDGFYCVDALFCSISQMLSNEKKAWISFTLDKSTEIAKIRVVTRNGISQFNHVTIYLGDSPINDEDGVHSFSSSYPVFGIFPSIIDPPYSTELTLAPAAGASTKGKYLSFVSDLSSITDKDQKFLVICEMMIIEA